MKVETLSSMDGTLLEGVRRTIAASEDLLIHVAFVQTRGIWLVERELKSLRQRGASLRMVVTTAFASTDPDALRLAHGLGARIKVLNPAGSTFHPKVFFGKGSGKVQAVVGSANLTGGLATNIEVGVLMEDSRVGNGLARLHDIAECLWNDPRAQPWQPGPGRGKGPGEPFYPIIHETLEGLFRDTPIVATLGRTPQPNRITAVTREEVLIETDRTRAMSRPPQRVPAWMFNIAWDYLQSHGTLTNQELLGQLRVHRSSAVCAILARVPGIKVIAGEPITLEWTGLGKGF